jgi:hypothetical protein
MDRASGDERVDRDRAIALPLQIPHHPWLALRYGLAPTTDRLRAGRDVAQISSE